MGHEYSSCGIHCIWHTCVNIYPKIDLFSQLRIKDPKVSTKISREVRLGAVQGIKKMIVLISTNAINAIIRPLSCQGRPHLMGFFRRQNDLSIRTLSKTKWISDQTLPSRKTHTRLWIHQNFFQRQSVTLSLTISLCSPLIRKVSPEQALNWN